MILAIDIGNTNIVLGCVEGKKDISSSSACPPTRPKQSWNTQSA